MEQEKTKGKKEGGKQSSEDSYTWLVYAVLILTAIKLVHVHHAGYLRTAVLTAALDTKGLPSTVRREMRLP
jgi:hypothetical protein